MVPFIQYNCKTIKELNFILDKNSIKYLISFHNSNINNLFFKKENFYQACSKNNLNIIKYIFNNLHNKNIDFTEALNYCCKQYNIKLILWLFKNHNFTEDDLYNSLKLCIKYDNFKLFKFINKKKNINIFKNNNQMLFCAIYNKRFDFIKYILSINNNIKIINNYQNIRNMFFIDNNEIINLIIPKIQNYEIDYKNTNILSFIIKSGLLNSLNYLLEDQDIKDYITLNIFKFIYHSFESQNIEIIKKLMSLDPNLELNYNFLYKRFIIFGDLKLIKFLYEKDNNIYFYDYLSLEKILKNKYFDIFLFILEKTNILDIDFNQKKLIEELMNQYYLQIILNLKKSDLMHFFDFVSNNELHIKYSNILYLINNLLSYNQYDKINTVKNIFPDYLCYSEDTLLEDSLKSHDLKCIKYALDLLNDTLENNKYKILYYSYLHSIHEIIYELDNDNSFEFISYDMPLIKNILKNDIEILQRLLSKKNLNYLDLNESITDIVFQTSNSETLKLFLPLLRLEYLNNDEIINKCVESDNFEMINILSEKINIEEIVEPNLIIKICNYGNIVFLKWFLELNIDINMYVKTSFNVLIMHEHYEQAIYFFNYSDNKRLIDLTYNNFSLFKEIIRKNNLYMINWFLNNFTDMNRVQFIIYLELQENIIQLIKYDNATILNSVMKRYKLNNNNLIKILYIYAFKNNKINTLIYLSQNYELKKYQLDLDYRSIFINCIKNNYYPIIDIIIKNINNYSWLNIISYYENNNDMFLYLIENYYDYLKIDEDLFFNILYTGNLESLKIFIKYYKGNIDYTRISEDDYIILIGYNNIELLEFIYQLNKNIDFSNNEYIIKLVTKLDKFEILEWLFHNFVFDNLHFEDSYLYYSAIVNKNINIINLLYKYDNIIKFNENKEKCLKIASQIKNIQIFKWFENKFDDSEINLNNKHLINNALLSNNIIVLEYILNKVDYDINDDDGLMIRTAFGNNMNDIIKFLFKKYDNIDVLVKNQIIMKYAIEDADIEIIDLLYNYNSNFNLSIDNEYLFRIACKMDHIDVVKWLYNKKNDINYQINNHEIFYYICEHNYINIALFYQELNKDLYEIKIENNEIIEYHVNKKIEINGDLKVSTIDRCPICLDENSKLITNCNHQFCEECLNKLNNKNEHFKCPLCRNDILTIKNLKL